MVGYGQSREASTPIPGIDQTCLFDRAWLNEKLHRVSDKSDKTQQPGLQYDERTAKEDFQKNGREGRRRRETQNPRRPVSW
ncbi:hypothetical protein FOPG_00490 [Fusarium oxysporum f. sp. conglutinans race 2 54008]|uniref:Uncharacterized protein n=1 Tax=Fusarium oxysporum f. sp. conglutinans race 2 54008 TaxID=1089457 RepID=X0IJI5_FUSOX|nr:hypothetical protein FOPG_00490 [Fusarium oxysporum f. sp. conglutinans race 2 54008]